MNSAEGVFEKDGAMVDSLQLVSYVLTKTARSHFDHP